MSAQALVDVLEEKRAAAKAELDAILEAPTAEKRDLNEDEGARFEAARAEIRKLGERLEELREQAEAEAREAASRASLPAGPAVTHEPRAVVTSEPRAYGDPRRSYFLDLARTQLNRGDGDGGVQAARDRLQRHARELEVDLPRRESLRDAAAEKRAVEGFGGKVAESMFERRVNPNRTDGQGGYFVPPMWLVDQYVDLPRYGRTTANLCQNFALPSGTDSVNLPKVSTGTATAVQTADAASVTSTDMTDSTVSAGVKTIAGQQDIAIQLLDQSPIAFDQVVFQDLIADYNQRLDVQVISGSGSSGQCTGILNVSGINSVTYTDASPTLPELWVPLLQSASKVATGRKMPATGVVLTPSMWYWALANLDSSNRPLIISNPATAYNNMGAAGAVEADGPAGTFTYGLPAFLDGNIPSNLGGGTNETRIITARFQDLYLWEGSLRTRVLSEVLSGTLQVRLQVYNYFAFMGDRRPTSISVISGTGVIPTSGY